MLITRADHRVSACPAVDAWHRRRPEKHLSTCLALNGCCASHHKVPSVAVVHDWYPELQEIWEAQQSGTLHEWVQAQDPTRLATLFAKWLDLPPTPPAPLPPPSDQLNYAAAVATHAAMVAAQDPAAAAAAAAEAAAAGDRSGATAAAAAGGEAGSSSAAAAGEHGGPQGLGSALRPPGPYLASCLAKAAGRVAPRASAVQQGGSWQTAGAACLLPGAAEDRQLRFGSTSASEATGKQHSRATTAVGTAPGAAAQAAHVGLPRVGDAILGHQRGSAAAGGPVEQAKTVSDSLSAGAEQAWRTLQGHSNNISSSDVDLVTVQDTSLVTVVLMSAGLRAATLQRRQHMDVNAARMRQTGDRNQPDLSRETSALAMRAAFFSGFGMRAAAARDAAACGLSLVDTDQDVHMEEADGPTAAAGSPQTAAAGPVAAAAAGGSTPDIAGSLPAGGDAATGNAGACAAAVSGPFKSCLAAGKPTPNLLEHSSSQGVQQAKATSPRDTAATTHVSADNIFEAAAVSLANIWAAYAAAEAAGAPCPESVREIEQFAQALGFPPPYPLPSCLRDAAAGVGVTGRATQQSNGMTGSMAGSTQQKGAAKAGPGSATAAAAAPTATAQPAAGTGSAGAAGATQAATSQATASAGSAAAAAAGAAQAAHGNPSAVPTIEEVQAMSDWETEEVRRLNALEPLPPYLAQPTTPAGMIAASIHRAQHEAQQRTQEAATARGFSPGSVAWHNAYAVRYSAMFGNMARKQMLPTADSLLDQFLVEHLGAMHLWMLKHQVGWSSVCCIMSLHVLGSWLTPGSAVGGLCEF